MKRDKSLEEAAAKILRGEHSLNEKETPIQKFPKELSRWSKNKKSAQHIAKAGHEDDDPEDDQVKVTQKSFRVKQLKPSQSTMQLPNALGMIYGMLDPSSSLKLGGDLECFISKDGYIMDGHHRWIASGMIDPAAEVQGKLVNMPGEKLVKLLNVITVGKLGNFEGKPGTGSFTPFTNKDLIAKTLYEIGSSKDKFGSPEIRQPALVNWVTNNLNSKVRKISFEQACELAGGIMAKNASQLTLKSPPFAMDRKDMPVIDKGKEASKTIKALSTGSVDWNNPATSKTTDSLQNKLK